MSVLARRVAFPSGLFLLFTLLLPSILSAQSQTGGSISGVVRDTSGGVLPGVTVEASSSALIEKVRHGVSDDQGFFRIINLNPGSYSVTFTLPGFSTVKRDGLELTGGFTATVNAELRVGSIEETVTVSGQSPLVDVQSATQRQTLTAQVIEDLPTARDASHMAVLIPGVTGGGGFAQDVGGTARPTGTHQLVIHGSKANDWPNVHDGMQFGSMYNLGSGSAGVWQANPAAVEEYAIDTSGAGADAASSGVRINIIPKQGGNRYTGYFLANFANSRLLSNNIDDAMVARGVSRQDPLRKLWDVNPALGGPLKKDKLWFYTAFRYTGLTEVLPNLFYDTDPNDFVFIRDTSRELLAPQVTHSQNLRLTWQTSRTTKLALYADNVPKDRPINALGFTGLASYEATTHFAAPGSNLYQATWTAIAGKVLLELGETIRPDRWSYRAQIGVPSEYSGVLENSTGARFRAPTSVNPGIAARQQNGKATVSYVTGAHHLKIGSQWFSGYRTLTNVSNNDSTYNLQNGVPDSITIRTTPYAEKENVKLNLGLFAQEQWTAKRLTVSAGLRFDYLNGYLPEQSSPPIQFFPVARQFPRLDVLNQKDLGPRIGVSYDLFGTARTALKFSAGKYFEMEAVTRMQAVNPLAATAGTATTRAWNDANRNFVPDCDLANPLANGECGANDNANFGKAIVPIRYAPGTVAGWGTRGANWELSGGIDHEVRPGFAVGASYNRRWFTNLLVTDNVLVTPSDYDPFCITSPTDSRLPGGGGQQICGLYDITSSKFGLNDNVVGRADRFGDKAEVYDGVDSSVSLRLRNRVTLQGGTSTGRIRTKACFVVDSPQELYQCEITPPFQTQVKIAAVYPLPWWKLNASATFQSLPGSEITASYSAPASAVSGLDRPLSGGRRTVTVNLVPSGTLYGDRLNQVDFRLTRSLTVKGTTVEPQLDLYNAFNANPILSYNSTYGSAWQNPALILKGRLVKVGVQIKF